MGREPSPGGGAGQGGRLVSDTVHDFPGDAENRALSVEARRMRQRAFAA